MDSHEIDSFDQVMHRNCCEYVNLYPQIAVLSTYMIVAHRNMISLYDMGAMDKQWIDTVKVGENHVRRLQVKKMPKNKRQKKSFFTTSLTEHKKS